jgi:hypothetical protein
MGYTPSYRESNRARLREALIAAVRDLTVTRGRDAVRMVDVARAILISGRGGADELLPYLTTRSDVVLNAAGPVPAERADTQLPDVPPQTPAVAIDSVVRLTVSHIMLPRDTPAGTATTLADVFLRLLAQP